MRIADAVFWKIMMITRRAEQTQADGEHAGDATGAERDLERGGQRTGTGRRRGAHVAAHREAHADEPGEPREQATGDERQRAERARTGRT